MQLAVDDFLGTLNQPTDSFSEQAKGAKNTSDLVFQVGANLLELTSAGRWSVDFVHDQFAHGGRFRVFNVIDDVTKECLAAIVSDHGTEFTSNAMLAWSEEKGVAWHFIAPASPCKTASVKPLIQR